MSNYQQWAARVLDDGVLTRDDALECLRTPDANLDALSAAALRVREASFGRRVKICALNNVQSGGCSEDCHYCSQSLVSLAEISVYPLKTMEVIENDARETYRRVRPKRYCMAASGRGPTDREVEHLARCVRNIRRELPMEFCFSIGFLNESQARLLKDAGVEWINHNLNTGRRFHPNICTTHSYDDRVKTVRAVKAAGLKVCSGGIIGMGETDEDIVDLAFELRQLDVDAIPVNFLHPVTGTPLDGRSRVPVETGVRVLSLFRFVHPRKEIRSAGGREYNFGDRSHLVFNAANSIFVEGYLTTPGQAADDARRMIESHGFEVESE